VSVHRRVTLLSPSHLSQFSTVTPLRSATTPNPPNEDYKRSTLSTDPHHSVVFFQGGPTSLPSVPKAPFSAVSTCAITRLVCFQLVFSALIIRKYLWTSSPRGLSGEEILNKQIRSNITKQTPPPIRPLWAVSRSAGSFQNLLVVRVRVPTYRIVKTNSPPFRLHFAARPLCSRIRILPCICIDRSAPFASTHQLNRIYPRHPIRSFYCIVVRTALFHP
jgi:hypothetical protein